MLGNLGQCRFGFFGDQTRDLCSIGLDTLRALVAALWVRCPGGPCRAIDAPPPPPSIRPHRRDRPGSAAHAVGDRVYRPRANIVGESFAMRAALLRQPAA